jgi:hypothetical protein
MTGNPRFTIWVHRRNGSMFGGASKPVNRDGMTLIFSDEGHARAECDRLNSSGDPYARYTVEREARVTHSDLERRLAELQNILPVR